MLFNENHKRKNEGLKSGIAAIAVMLMMSIVLVSTASATTFNVPGTYTTIQDAINAASSGDTIIVGAGSYSESLIINKKLVLKGANFGFNPNTGVRGAETIIAGAVTISGNDVTLDGFRINNPGSSNGVYVNSVSTISLTNNIIDFIGTSLGSGSAQAIYIKTLDTDISDITVSNNKISNVGNTGLKTSTKGIFVGDSTGSGKITNLIISGNSISDVKVSNAADGKGAYGILINHASPTNGGQTVNAQILNNIIDNLQGRWVHAIGLEGNTPNAIVTGNIISNLADTKSPSDAVGVFVEANPGVGTIGINNNRFEIAVYWGVMNIVPSTTVNAKNNWWGDCSGPYHSVKNPTGTASAKINEPLESLPFNMIVDFQPWTVTSCVSTQVPEFPTVALPIIAIIGLMFLFRRKKGNQAN